MIGSLRSRICSSLSLLPSFSPSLRRLGTWTTLLVLLPAAAGCGGAKGNVSGTVTYKGKPVKFGMVLIMDEQSAPHAAPIQDGRYEIRGVPVGQVRLSVVSPSPEQLEGVKGIPTGPKPPPAPEVKPGQKRPKVQPPRKKRSPFTPENPDEHGWFAIPEKYNYPMDSGLTCTVTRGDVVYDIILVDAPEPSPP